MAEGQTNEVEQTTLGLLPAIAAEVAKAFPQLEGRALAVSEVDAFDKATNIPSLPVAVVALLGEEATQGKHGGRIGLVDQIVIQMMLEPAKYKRADGEESPFYAYYDYQAIRDVMLETFNAWRTPSNGSMQYVSMDVSSDEYAVAIAFRFNASFDWCSGLNDPTTEGPLDFTITSRVLTPSGKCEPLNLEVTDPCSALGT